MMHLQSPSIKYILAPIVTLPASTVNVWVVRESVPTVILSAAKNLGVASEILSAAKNDR